jgi:protein-tyrosine phosphatase
VSQDLLLPEEGESGFSTHRCPLRDLEEEDISVHFDSAADFIDCAAEQDGIVLVHCHAGRSRSCSLVLAWLMMRRRWTLRKALDFVQQERPQVAPNAGYLAALLSLEEKLFGRQTVKAKKTRPLPR